MKGDFAVYDLRETYHELGDYEFKIVLNPSRFKNCHECTLEMKDSDGTRMNFEVNKWGRKMNCSFRIDPSVADGVSSVVLKLSSTRGSKSKQLLRFWVIKP